MTDERKELVELGVDDGGFGFTVRWCYEPHWANVEVWEVSGLVEGDPKRPRYLRKGATNGTDCVDSIDEAEYYLHGHIKWDACSHLEIGETHFCDWPSYKNHVALIEYLYRRSRVLMNREDEWRGREQQPERESVIRELAVRAEFTLLEQRREFTRGDFGDLDQLEDAIEAYKRLSANKGQPSSALLFIGEDGSAERIDRVLEFTQVMAKDERSTQYVGQMVREQLAEGKSVFVRVHEE